MSYLSRFYTVCKTFFWSMELKVFSLFSYLLFKWLYKFRRRQIDIAFIVVVSFVTCLFCFSLPEPKASDEPLSLLVVRPPPFVRSSFFRLSVRLSAHPFVHSHLWTLLLWNLWANFFKLHVEPSVKNKRARWVESRSLVLSLIKEWVQYNLVYCYRKIDR